MQLLTVLFNGSFHAASNLRIQILQLKDYVAYGVTMKGFSKRLFWLVLVVVVCLSSWLGPAVASGTDPRLIQLEFEVSTLQNQLAQLQNQLSRQAGVVIETRPARPPNLPIERPVSVSGDLSFDAQFDNLATLVIEINQRVIAIEEQLSDSSR